VPYVAMTKAEETENLRLLLVVLNDPSKNRLDDWGTPSAQAKGKNWSYDDAAWLRRMVRDWIIGGLSPGPRDHQRLERYRDKVRVDLDGSVIDFYTGDTAAMHLARLIRNSRKTLLRECLKCPKWFVAEDPRAEFCSKRCGGNARSARLRKREHDRKIEKARRAIKNYLTRPARFAKMTWKEYVSEAAGVSKKFLTTAVRDGELSPPEYHAPSVH
jgi:hypothetical protein